jgi:ribonuclease BN (tRNA processing enzyme)
VPCKSTIELARNVDLLLYMSPGATNAPDRVTARRLGWHAPRDVGDATAESGTKRLVIVHMMGGRYDDLVASQLNVDEIAQSYDGPIILGEDLMEVTPA